jgi:hypothetical protein
MASTISLRSILGLDIARKTLTIQLSPVVFALRPEPEVTREISLFKRAQLVEHRGFPADK